MRISLFDSFPRLRYGISDRHDGPMKLVGDGSAARDARATYFAKEKIDADHVVSAGLVHGKHIERVVFLSGGEAFANTDGLVTTTVQSPVTPPDPPGRMVVDAPKIPQSLHATLCEY